MLISLFKYNQPTTEIHTSIYRMGGPSGNYLWSLGFSSNLLTLGMFTSSAVV